MKSIATPLIVPGNFARGHLPSFVPTITRKGLDGMNQSLEKLETILVVDDTPMILKVVVAILNAANFNVLQARNGEEAMKSGGRRH